jgi:hypothetical protein
MRNDAGEPESNAGFSQAKAPLFVVCYELPAAYFNVQRYSNDLAVIVSCIHKAKSQWIGYPSTTSTVETFVPAYPSTTSAGAFADIAVIDTRWLLHNENPDCAPRPIRL